MSSLPAASVLELYQQRGSFEQVLSDEDAEQDPDRWCSHRPYGQELWQLICQWVWNSRLSLGSVSSGAELRWTKWGSESAAPEAETGSRAEAPQTVEGTDQLAEVSPAMTVTNRPSEAAEREVPSYGPLRLAYSRMKPPPPYGAPSFQVGEHDTLI